MGKQVEEQKILKKEFVLGFNKELGTGPLLSTVYDGTYGCAPSDHLTKYSLKRILIKEIDARYVSDEVDWGMLRQLDHPNVASYIFIRERKGFCAGSNILIVQNYCEYTLDHLAKLLNYNWVTGQVIKSVVKGIADGLTYLHGQSPDPIVHRNLKPSNILVKPPLALPSGIVLTDFWYSNHTHMPHRRQFCLLCSSATDEDNPEILKWMAPELRRGGVVSGSGTPMMDMYSFGLVLEYLLSQGPLPLDQVDEYLFKLLIHETMLLKPSQRIRSKDVLFRHPLLMEFRQRNLNDTAKARIRFVKEGYDRILDVELSSKKKKIRDDIDLRARCIIGSNALPWHKSEESNDSFNYRIFSQMKIISQKPFNPYSFFDLLRLIRYSKKFLSVESSKNSILLKEIASDAFNRSYPYVIPLVYIFTDCKIDPAMFPSTIFGVTIDENSLQHSNSKTLKDSQESQQSSASIRSSTIQTKLIPN